MTTQRPDVRRRHFNLWIAEVVAISVHMWVAWAMFGGLPKGDLLKSSYLFTLVPPPAWGAFSVATGVGMLYGIVRGPYLVQQVSAAWGVIMGMVLSLNGMVEIIRLYATGTTPPLAVKLVPGLAAFYVIGHFAFAVEPPENPATHR